MSKVLRRHVAVAARVGTHDGVPAGSTAALGRRARDPQCRGSSRRSRELAALPDVEAVLSNDLSTSNGRKDQPLGILVVLTRTRVPRQAQRDNKRLRDRKEWLRNLVCTANRSAVEYARSLPAQGRERRKQQLIEREKGLRGSAICTALAARPPRRCR